MRQVKTQQRDRGGGEGGGEGGTEGKTSRGAWEEGDKDHTAFHTSPHHRCLGVVALG